jgi:competence protein ComEC
LITGDISSSVESRLIATGRNLKSNVLFVPHHGSVHSSSNAFIQAVSPQYAIVSAGRNNVFRHPHPEVLKRYAASGIKIFRTDQQGAIAMKTDGKAFEISPWLK